MRLLIVLLASSLCAGCITINNSALSGERSTVKTDADAQQTVSPHTTATIPLK